MADKNKTAEDEKVAEERRSIEKRRLMQAGAVLAAVTLFVGGYAVGNAADDDDDSFVRSDVIVDERRPDRFPDRERIPERRRDRFPDGFDFPEDFEDFEFRFPEDFEDFEFRFPRGFERCFEFHYPPEPGDGFHFPEDCQFFERFDIPFEDFEFRFPEDFELPFPRDFFDEDPIDPGAAFEAGFLGVVVFGSPEGVVVAEILEGSAADTAGIVDGDVIVEVAGISVDSVEDLAVVVAEAGAGAEVEVFVLRGDRAISFDVELGERPS